MPKADGVAVVWEQFGPYHMDRCEALGRRFRGHRPVYGLEIAPASDLYAWAATGSGQNFEKITLFPGRIYEATGTFERWRKLVAACWSCKVRTVFVVNYNGLDIFLLAVAMRILGKRVYLMFESKSDDKPRHAWREPGKIVMILPYNGALAGGPRAAGYLRFLGFGKRPIVIGCCTVSMERVVAAAGEVAAPDFAARHFVLVARFVPKKDIATAIAAYARYRELARGTRREFHICGSGPLEDDIRRQIRDLRLDGVVLHGFLQHEGIARVLSAGLCLVLPSVEEQWGLVVNEALAFCLPILVTDQVGARDLLVRSAINGYIFEPGNVEGLARLMLRLSEDEAEWRRLVEGSRHLRHLADTERFADAVETLIGPSHHQGAAA